MVTANSLDFKAINYRFSADPNEAVLYERSKTAYNEVVTRLKPILHYVTTEEGYDDRGIVLRFSTLFQVKNADIVMDRSGRLYSRNHDTDLCEYCVDDAWEMLPFVTLLSGLRDILVKAEEKKRQDMEAIAQRREFVEGVLASFQAPRN